MPRAAHSSWDKLPQADRAVLGSFGFIVEGWDGDPEEHSRSSVLVCKVPSLVRSWRNMGEAARSSWRTLGYAKRTWDDEDDSEAQPPISATKRWWELGKTMQEAARRIGYDMELWHME